MLCDVATSMLDKYMPHDVQEELRVHRGAAAAWQTDTESPI